MFSELQSKIVFKFLKKKKKDKSKKVRAETDMTMTIHAAIDNDFFQKSDLLSLISCAMDDIEQINTG